MPADFSSITNHPDSEEIISKLLQDGVEPRTVMDWLKLRYPDKQQGHLRLPLRVLKEFQNSGYNAIYMQANQSLQTDENGELTLDPQLAKSLVNNKTFQERVHQVLDEKIDLDQAFKGIYVGLMARMEQTFDKIQQNPEGFKGDYVLLKYFEQLMSFVEKYDKYKNNRPDMIIQHNHTVAYVDKYTACLQQAVLEVLQEIDPEIALLCQERLSEKLSDLNAPAPETIPTQSQLLTEARILEGTIVSSRETI